MKSKRATKLGEGAPAGSKFGNATEVKAGSNWKSLKKTLAAENPSAATKPTASLRATKHIPAGPPAKTSTEKWGGTALAKAGDPTGNGKAVATTSASGASTSSRPWFADDLKAEDLALATSITRDITARSMHWEGIMDPALKRQIILEGPVKDAIQMKKKEASYIAVDCEMVGVGPKGSESHLARVSLVDFHGNLVLDRYVRPMEKVTDYRTWVSGIRPRHLRDAPPFSEVQAEVARLIKGKVLVGHAIQNDLKALMLSHPHALIRDTAAYQGLRDIAQSKMPSLRKLAKLVLGIDIQVKGQPHSSVEDARATMAVFRTQKVKWDESLRGRKGRSGSGTAVVDHDATSAVTDANADAGAGGSAIQRMAGKFASRIWQPPSPSTSAASEDPKWGRAAMTGAAGTKRKVEAGASGGGGGGGGGGGVKRVKTVMPQASGPAKPRPKVAAKSDWWKDDF
ncbi:uncharacterized protein PFL1_04014 [Pseudozyma flocculosa PF-1]|uniref:RNA exonuclease 4 n=2 Tax=Pseudozyma flocculosa TaxID=84751 RepID=A0A5C3EVX5_9BASI|nr:uncharacterized protein PFL1_04014 [Pseudozyma flocculosa PF-1]EPQ28185.1 hypothetical protein PFL1_04014 [Pseudozyma flocculosa PF-1]SPO35319.1 related to RNA exonuclease 4 [Pseudozyma flocculosa]